jgi:hypothetical protein
MRKQYKAANPRSIEYLAVIENHLNTYEARVKDSASEQLIKYIERRRAEIEEQKRKYC